MTTTRILHLVVLLHIAATAFAQQNSSLDRHRLLVPVPTIHFQLKGIQTPLLLHLPPSTTTASSIIPVFLPRWRAEELPFFCKIEHQWGKKMTIPFKFRLGSVEYVDWLEGKK